MSSPLKSSIQQRRIDDKSPQTTNGQVDYRAYQPSNLANVFCDMFADHPEALINAFCEDPQMFEYLYQHLPQDIIIGVLNNISIGEAIEIVRRKRCPHNIYDMVDPLLYVVRYFGNISGGSINDGIKNKPTITKEKRRKIDKHCKSFDYNIIPKNSKLNFALECETYLAHNEFQTFLELLNQECTGYQSDSSE